MLDFVLHDEGQWQESRFVNSIFIFMGTRENSAFYF